MAGINQGRPELAVGEPIRLGSNNEFEIEQHPVSDRLIIRDTQNGKVAYVRKERGGKIGGDGVLIKALKEGKPMADDGRVYDTVQQAERAAGSWVFVPPGTYNENVEITTQGLKLQGCGYNTLIDGGSVSNALTISSNNTTISNLSIRTIDPSGDSNSAARGIESNGAGCIISNVTIRDSGGDSISIFGDDSLVINSIVETSARWGIRSTATDNCLFVGCVVKNTSNSTYPSGRAYQTTDSSGTIISNNIAINSGSSGITIFDSSDAVVVGNRVTDSKWEGIEVIDDKTTSENNIIANNRVSDSGIVEIRDNGSGTVLDANLTGASN